MPNTRKTAIHVTSIGSWLRCRLAWFWGTEEPWGLYLEPTRGKEALSFGSVVHKCMQERYDHGTPMLETYEQVTQNYDLYEDTIELGKQMLLGYENWAKTADLGLTTIANETNWHVKLNRYWLEGTYDRLVERNDGLWVLDYKTTSYLDTSWTLRDLQATAYVMAARALYGDAVQGVIFRFLRKVAPKNYHKLILKKGDVTERKGLETSTTLENYLEALAVAVCAEMVPFPEEVANSGEDRLDYYARILKEPELHDQEWYPIFKEMFMNARRMYWNTLQRLDGKNAFYWDAYEYRTSQQLDKYAQHIFLPAMREMTTKSKTRWIGPTGLGTSIFTCKNCSFRTPCGLVMDGADYRTVLEVEYQKRTPR